jgi:uncharacterized protein (TIGR01777 family)
MRIAVAGTSGLVGSAVCPALRSAGHEVARLVRHAATAQDEIAWDPSAGQVDVARLEGANAIINLAGENLAAGRWTSSRRERIIRSRVDATRTLVLAIAKLSRRPDVFVNASAVGFYGDRGDEVLTEASPIGHGFLPEVCLAWETHAEGAGRLGVRTVLLRFGIILAREGGALAKMLPLFRLGLGGRLGTGRQWMSWVAMPDVVGAIHHVLRDRRCVGPINIVAPGAVTNSEFTASLGRVLRRPAFMPVPAWALRIAVGKRMADEALLASTRAAPQRLSETGFVFGHATIDTALAAIL